MTDCTLMYQRGKFTPGSRATAMAVALLLMLGIFSLVPLINQFNSITRSGVRGLSPVATAPSARIESDQDSSSSIQTSRIELGAWDSVPIGWTPMPKPVLDVPLELEMPELQHFEASDEARVHPSIENAPPIRFNSDVKISKERLSPNSGSIAMATPTMSRSPNLIIRTFPPVSWRRCLSGSSSPAWSTASPSSSACGSQ